MTSLVTHVLQNLFAVIVPLRGTLAVIVTSLILYPTAKAQETVWTRTFGGSWPDGAHALQQTSDGGFIVVGFASSFSTNHADDIYFIKTDPEGNQQWSRLIGGALDDIGSAVRQTTDGGYIIAGRAGVTAQIFDPYLVRTDSSGNVLWERAYDFGLGADDRAHSVWQTSDGGFIFAGQTRLGTFPFDNYDIHVVRTDPNGNPLWQRTFASGEFGNDVGMSIQQLSNGDFILGGFTQGGLWDAYVFRLDSLGNTIWVRTYGGSFADECYSIKPTADGGFIMSGVAVSPGAGDTDLLLIKMDANGEPEWERIYGGKGGFMAEDAGRSVREMADGSFVVAGHTSSFGAGNWDLYVVRVDAVGDTLWTRVFGGSADDRAWAVELTEDQEIVVAGWAYSFGAGYGDVYLMKLTSGIPSAIACQDISRFQARCSLGNRILARATLTSTKYDGQTMTFTVDGTDVFPVTISLGRASLSVPGYGTGSHVVELTSPDGCYEPVNVQCGTYPTETIGDEWPDEEGATPIRRVPEEASVLRGSHPNPFNSTTNIRYHMTENSWVKLQIYDMLGREVRTLVNEFQQAGEYSAHWTGTNSIGEQVSSGLFFYRLSTGNDVLTGTMMLMK